MVYIVAGTYQQAQYLAKKREYDKWEYISTAESVMGLRDQKFVYYGTWWERSNINDIIGITRANGQCIYADGSPAFV